MVNKIQVYESSILNPYINIATEKYLLDHTDADTCLLYLWQNQNTVVIGHNQNPWAECRTGLLEEEGGTLARRLSGGGAVFHDLGNLNFTFLVSESNYDLDRQLSVIQTACKLAGIHAEKSGRNDILAEGRKFSGNAFYHNQGHAYHHGTLLVDVDMSRLQRYLSPPKAKLESKGVASVRSRVVNLKELSPGLTIQKMKEYMKSAFRQVYGLMYSDVFLNDDDWTSINALASLYSSNEYLYGVKFPFSMECQSYFQWGYVHLQLQIKSGIISNTNVYSDSMDWELPSKIKDALNNCKLTRSDIDCNLNRCVSDPSIVKDLNEMISQQIFL